MGSKGVSIHCSVCHCSLLIFIEDLKVVDYIHMFSDSRTMQEKNKPDWQYK